MKAPARNKSLGLNFVSGRSHHTSGRIKPMPRTTIALGLGLFFLAAMPAPAEIVKGVMAIKGAEMS